MARAARRWIGPQAALAIHEEQIVEHGGAPGVRDLGALNSALARPRHLETYGSPDLADLAAAYAAGIARNHPFVDGNKRTAWVVSETFLLLNGATLSIADEAAYDASIELAAGRLDERAMATLLRGFIKTKRG